MLAEVSPPKRMNFEGHFVSRIDKDNPSTLEIFFTAQDNQSHQGKIIRYQLEYESKNNSTVR